MQHKQFEIGSNKHGQFLPFERTSKNMQGGLRQRKMQCKLKTSKFMHTLSSYRVLCDQPFHPLLQFDSTSRRFLP